MPADLRPSARGRHYAPRRSRMPRWPGRHTYRGGGRRWPRRLLIGGISLLTVAVLLLGGTYFYARYRFGQFHKAKVAGLTTALPGKAFDVLLVGSDSRAFVDTPGETAAFGSKQGTSGQRSDVIIVARIDPTTHQVRLLSIPRDTYVDIPGTSDVSGPNRINAAFDSGPSLLVETIKDTFHIPITYYAEVNFPGFSGMVNALGGIYLDFRYPVRDAYSGLSITTTGCQLVKGTQGLALVRSRHLYYLEDGTWHYDGLSDFSRIQRQDAFFRAVVARLHGAISNPVTLNSFLGATTKNVTIDDTLSESELFDLANLFRSFTSAELVVQTLPTAPATVSGADILLPAVTADESVITKFLAFGSGSTTTAAAPRPAVDQSSAVRTSSAAPDSAVLVADVLASTVATLAPVTTVPGSPAVSPGDVVYNTQSEPWNPVPCSP